VFCCFDEGGCCRVDVGYVCDGMEVSTSIGRGQGTGTAHNDSPEIRRKVPARLAVQHTLSPPAQFDAASSSTYPLPPSPLQLPSRFESPSSSVPARSATRRTRRFDLVGRVRLSRGLQGRLWTSHSGLEILGERESRRSGGRNEGQLPTASPTLKYSCDDRPTYKTTLGTTHRYSCPASSRRRRDRPPSNAKS
jgi:hypothetical protein